MICYNDFPINIQEKIKAGIMNTPYLTLDLLNDQYKVGRNCDNHYNYIPIFSIRDHFERSIDVGVRCKRSIVAWLNCLKAFELLTLELETELMAFVLSAKC